MSCRTSPRPANLPAGTIWREKPRLNIPGSIWLPDTGYGALAPATEDYLRAGLERLTGGDRGQAPRVLLSEGLLDVVERGQAGDLAMGYTNVAWYPDGTDGWQEAGLPLEEADAGCRSPRSVSYSSACWIARPSANSRRSIRSGTSQT